MANNINTLAKVECCGCRVCGDICPTKCISFIPDVEGFIYPSANENQCISCGLCISSCPEINQLYNKRCDSCFACYATNTSDREAGSSGGIFGLLAKEIISKGGSVWGAGFNDNLELIHREARTLSDLYILFKSKYIQSNPSSVYVRIKDEIKKGNPCLFSGTPCQCNALRNYVGEAENLILIEIICHGVPSQYLFDKHIKWIEKKKV